MYIKSIEVIGLHRYLNKKIEFERNLNFITGVNGSGKSSILKIIDAILLGTYDYFFQIEFKEIILRLNDDFEKIISLKMYEKKNEDLAIYYSEKEAGKTPWLESLIFPQENLKSKFNYNIKKYNCISIGVNRDFDEQKFNNFFREYQNNKSTFSVKEKIHEIVMPIEQIGEVLNKISKDYLIEKGDNKVKNEILSIIQSEKTLYLDSEDTTKLEQAKEVLQKILYSDNTKPLVGEMKESKIKKYLEILYKFLKDGCKEMTFDFKNAEFQIVINDKNGNKIKTLPNYSVLSSGEQQILILITMIMFSDIDDKVIIIDEPELSLHLRWQQLFLKEIQGIVRNETQLIIATHSPDIVAETPDENFKDLFPYNE